MESDSIMAEKGTVGRILRLIGFLSDNPEISAKQAALQLGWPISTTHRLLRTLASVDFAVQRETGVFAPGLELFRIAGRLAAELPYEEVAQPLLDRLTQHFNETTLLSILERKQLSMYIAFSAAPPDPMRYAMEHNRRLSLTWGASGRAILAHLQPEEVEAAIANPGGPNIQGEMLDADELRRALEQIRRDGYSVTDSHRTPQAFGIATAFFNSHGEPAGAVAFRVPAFRYRSEMLPAMTDALKRVAAAISGQFGAGAASSGTPAAKRVADAPVDPEY